MLHQFLNFFKRICCFIEEIFSASVICHLRDRKDLKLFNELYVDDEPTEIFSIRKLVVIIFKAIALFVFVAIIPYLMFFLLNKCA